MDDWSQPASEREDASAQRIVPARAVDHDAVSELVALVDDARSPALVVGADADDADSWAALVRVAEHLACPVWQESFGARAGFPQDHPLFAGHLPGDRGGLRRTLSGHDVVLVVGAPVFRQYGGYPGGRLVEEGTRVALVTEDADEALRSPAELVALGDPAT